MARHIDELQLIAPAGGWPAWVFEAPYQEERHPASSGAIDPRSGANCQAYAYAVLALFGVAVPPHRSSELWGDPCCEHVAPTASQALDLVLFNSSASAWGAHVAVVTGVGLLHLCAEVGKPALWDWSDFASRQRYRTIVGIVRAPATTGARFDGGGEAAGTSPPGIR